MKISNSIPFFKSRKLTTSCSTVCPGQHSEMNQMIWSHWSSTIEHWILMVFATFACTLGYSFGTFHFFSLDDRVETRIGSATNEFSIACHQDCIQVHFFERLTFYCHIITRVDSQGSSAEKSSGFLET